MRILLADDRDDDVVLLTEAFRLVGLEPDITRVSNGQQVLDLIAPPASIVWDVLVLDYYLPIKDGAKVVEQLNTWQVIPAVPCAMLSSFLRSEEKTRLSELGVKFIGEKPNDLDGLCALARDLASLAEV